LNGGGRHAVDAPFIAVDVEQGRDASGGGNTETAGGLGGFSVQRVTAAGTEEAEDLQDGGVVEKAGSISIKVST
jgi:hypothetical protein